jgi:hypothetical protein
MPATGMHASFPDGPGRGFSLLPGNVSLPTYFLVKVSSDPVFHRCPSNFNVVVVLEIG